MNVVFSIGALYGGGSERQIVSLLQTIDRKKFVPRLYLVNRHGPLLGQVPPDVPVDVFEERYQGRSLSLPGYMHRQRVKDMSRYLREVGADVSYDRTFLMTLIAADAAQRSGVPNVSTIVTDPPRGFATVAGRFQSSKRRRLRRLYQNSARVLAVSSGAADSAARFYQIPRSCIQTAQNGVNIRAVQQAARQRVDNAWWTAPPRADRQLFRIVSAGRLNREKGFHLLIDAVADFSSERDDLDVRLAILGEGPDHQILQQQIAAREVRDVVRLVGFHTAAPAWYAAADVFVLASFLEGMPNVLLEAMAVETPIIATDCLSGPREILGDSQFGSLISTGSRKAIVDALRDAVAFPQRQRDFSRRGLERVESEFSIDVATRRLEKIFAEVVGSTR